MPTLVFFKNVRRDHGVRTGIGIDGDRVFHDFVPGAEEEDPALDWFLDVRCEGESIPSDPDDAKQWLLTALPAIREGIDELATRLEVGLDAESFPVSQTVAHPPDDVTIRIYCSAVRKLRAGNIAELLAQARDSLEHEIGALPRETEASHGC